MNRLRWIIELLKLTTFLAVAIVFTTLRDQTQLDPTLKTVMIFTFYILVAAKAIMLFAKWRKSQSKDYS